MHTDMAILISVLMKNEDVFLNMPSQKIFDEICLSLQLLSITRRSDRNTSVKTNGTGGSSVL